MDKKALHKRKMAGRKAARDEKDAADKPPAPVDDSSDDDEGYAPSRGGGGGKKSKGIKWKYVAFLALLFGSAILPALLWVVDNVGGLLGAGASSSISGLGAKLGMSATPTERLTSFYEKHNPDKVDEVDALIAKYAGNYPKMVKVLEAKYGDYGYFMGWENDASFTSFLSKEGAKWAQASQFYYRRYMPYKARMAFYKMYEALDRIFGPSVNLVRTILLDWLSPAFPSLESWIGKPPGYRPPKATTARRRAASNAAKGKAGANKRRAPKSTRTAK